jgi:hypothetical protein
VVIIQTSAPKTLTLLPNVSFSNKNTQLTTKDAQFTKLISKKKTITRFTPAKDFDYNVQSKTKSYAKTTKNQNLYTEYKIADTLSSFITNLKSLISPLISLLSIVLNALTTNSNN